MTKVYIISDLHLDENHRVETKIFLNLLNELSQNITQNHKSSPNEKSTSIALYILGDFFEYWIGDDDPNPFYNQIQSALQKAGQLFPIFIMHGNRDFLIGKNFAARNNVQLIPDPWFIKTGNQSYMLMHGDLLCTSDIKYQRYRYWAHKKWLQYLFCRLPLSFRISIAKSMRRQSSRSQEKQKISITDVAHSSVIEFMQKESCSQLIHGHTHRHAHHTFSLYNKKHHRWVLASWEKAGQIFVIDHSDIVSFELKLNQDEKSLNWTKQKPPIYST